MQDFQIGEGAGSPTLKMEGLTYMIYNFCKIEMLMIYSNFGGRGEAIKPVGHPSGHVTDYISFTLTLSKSDV